MRIIHTSHDMVEDGIEAEEVAEADVCALTARADGRVGIAGSPVGCLFCRRGSIWEVA